MVIIFSQRCEAEAGQHAVREYLWHANLYRSPTCPEKNGGWAHDTTPNHDYFFRAARMILPRAGIF